MEYTVVIRKEHCIGTTYMNCEDCALARAIRQQLPLLKFNTIGGMGVYLSYDEEWLFDFNYNTGWHGDRMRQILNNEIESHTVTFTSPNHIAELSEANVIEASKIANTELEVV